MRGLCCAFMLLTAVMLTTEGQSQPAPRALSCTFTNGTSSSFDADWATNAIRDRLDITIGAIDVADRKAQLIGNQGASDLYVSQGNNGLHFLEMTDARNQTLTTIFFGAQKAGAFAAIHSRHMAIAGRPVVSQYRGYCIPKN